MSIKKYKVQIRYTTPSIHETHPYAADEDQAMDIALKMFHDEVRDAENKSPKVIEVSEIK